MLGYLKLSIMFTLRETIFSGEFSNITLGKYDLFKFLKFTESNQTLVFQYSDLMKKETKNYTIRNMK